MQYYNNYYNGQYPIRENPMRFNTVGIVSLPSRYYTTARLQRMAQAMDQPMPIGIVSDMRIVEDWRMANNGNCRCR